MNVTRFSSRFSEKILFPGKRVILGIKMVRPHNFGSAVRIFLKFCTMKGTKRYIKLILMVFLKKKFWLGLVGHFGPKIIVHPVVF